MMLIAKGKACLELCISSQHKNITLMWWVLLSLLLVAICWLLWAPIRMEINTQEGVYRVGWSGLGTLDWLPEQGLDVIELRLFFWKKRWVLSEIQSKQRRSATKPAPAKSKVGKKSKSSFVRWQLAKKIARTFKVRQCQLWIDTGDYVWNAWLFPAGWFFRKPNVGVWINFQGKNEGLLLVENRLSRVLWAIISSRVY